MFRHRGSYDSSSSPAPAGEGSSSAFRPGSSTSSERSVLFADEGMLEQARRVLESSIIDADSSQISLPPGYDPFARRASTASTVHPEARDRGCPCTPPPSILRPSSYGISEGPRTSSIANLHQSASLPPSSTMPVLFDEASSEALSEDPAPVPPQMTPVEERRRSFEFARLEAALLATSPSPGLAPHNTSLNLESRVRSPSPLARLANTSESSNEDVADRKKIGKHESDSSLVIKDGRLEGQEKPALPESSRKGLTGLTQSVSQDRPQSASKPVQRTKSILSKSLSSAKVGSPLSLSAQFPISSPCVPPGRNRSALSTSASASGKAENMRRPTPRRSLSASLVSLVGKKVAQLSRLGGSGSSSLKKSNSTPLAENRKETCSRKDSPADTWPHSKPEESLSPSVIKNPSTNVGHIDESFAVVNRPVIKRNPHSDDSAISSESNLSSNSSRPPADILSSPSSSTSGIGTSVRGRALSNSPVAPQTSASPARQLGKIPELDENWNASLRGKTGKRRMSAADLFAPNRPRESEVLQGQAGVNLVRDADLRVLEEERELDFSKKPILPASQSSISTNLVEDAVSPTSSDSPIIATGLRRPRTTSYSSLLSASRPNTPASSPPPASTKPFPGIPVSASSPILASRILRQHRHTQSLPSGVPDLPHLGGRDTAVLEASGAKFAAVLTAAAVAANASHTNLEKRRASNRMVIRNRASLKRLVTAEENEAAFESSEDDEDEHDEEDSDSEEDCAEDTEGSATDRPVKTRLSSICEKRVPKLSYGTESSTEEYSNFSGPDSVQSFTASVGLTALHNTIAEEPVFTAVKLASAPSLGPESGLFLASEKFDFYEDLSTANRRQANTSEETTVSTSSKGTEGSISKSEDDVFCPKVSVW